MGQRLSLGEVEDRELAALLAYMLAECAVQDAQPGTMEIVFGETEHDVYVRSRSLGSICIGHIDVTRWKAHLFDELYPVAHAIEAGTRAGPAKARATKERGTNARRSRAYNLMDEGWSDAEIARTLTRERDAKPGAARRPAIHPRTIEKWRSERRRAAG